MNGQNMIKFGQILFNPFPVPPCLTSGSSWRCSMRIFCFASLLIAISVASGQTNETATQIYSSSQESVFLVYLNDGTGSPSALGSAFLVAPRLLITNAHVAEAGSPVLAIGPVRIPLKVIRIDQKNDLAILSVDVDLTSKPLPLASGNVSPGDQIFAIGNPEGLEKDYKSGDHFWTTESRWPQPRCKSPVPFLMRIVRRPHHQLKGAGGRRCGCHA